jgi:hypothetical protein
MGVVGALFFLMLISTGLLLNHTDALRLDQRHVRLVWLLNYYDVKPPHDPLSFRAGDHIVSQLGARFYLDGRELAQSEDRLLGATQAGATLAVAAGDKLWLFDRAGKLIEQLGRADGLPSGLLRLGRAPDENTIAAATHDGYYSLALDTLRWTETSGERATWSEPVATPEDLREQLIAAYRGTGLPLERVLLDLHSGRLFGSWGVYLVDIAALFFLFLVATGLWMWVRRTR